MWKVGDIAWHITRNQEVEITNLGGWPTENGCDCSIHIPGCLSSVRDGNWSTYFSKLRPLPDAKEKTTWDECAFKPKVLERVG